MQALLISFSIKFGSPASNPGYTEAGPPPPLNSQPDADTHTSNDGRVTVICMLGKAAAAFSSSMYGLLSRACCCGKLTMAAPETGRRPGDTGWEGVGGLSTSTRM